MLNQFQGTGKIEAVGNPLVQGGADVHIVPDLNLTVLPHHRHLVAYAGQFKTFFHHIPFGHAEIMTTLHGRMDEHGLVARRKVQHVGTVGNPITTRKVGKVELGNLLLVAGIEGDAQIRKVFRHKIVLARQRMPGAHEKLPLIGIEGNNLTAHTPGTLLDVQAQSRQRHRHA